MSNFPTGASTNWSCRPWMRTMKHSARHWTSFEKSAYIAPLQAPRECHRRRARGAERRAAGAQATRGHTHVDPNDGTQDYVRLPRL
jgi:hypothetical protein